MANTPSVSTRDRKSTRLNSSHTEIYTLSLHDALPICYFDISLATREFSFGFIFAGTLKVPADGEYTFSVDSRSEEHTSELQSHRDLHSFPTRRSSDLLLRHLACHS